MYNVQISDGKRKTYNKREELYSMGFRFNKNNKTWEQKENDISMISAYKNIAKRNKFKIKVFPEHFARDREYRKKFFNTHPADIKDRYFCSYCGKLLRKEEVTVDHIVPISKAQKSKYTQYLLKRLKIEDINDMKNLTASCMYCNARKGDKTGFWLLRGFVGKYRAFWLTAYILLFVWIICLTYTVVRLL